MFLNVLCCLVVYLAVQVFTKNVGLTCVISHIALMTFAGINYFVYLFRGNEFIFSDLRSISTGLSVAGNYEFVLDDRAAYVVLLSALYVAFVRKIHVTFEKSPLDGGRMYFRCDMLLCLYWDRDGRDSDRDLGAEGKLPERILLNFGTECT